jgi:hypothetical protein
MSLMAARWVLKNVYEQDLQAPQHAFEPQFVERDSTAPPAANS